MSSLGSYFLQSLLRDMRDKTGRAACVSFFLSSSAVHKIYALRGYRESGPKGSQVRIAYVAGGRSQVETEAPASRARGIIRRACAGSSGQVQPCTRHQEQASSRALDSSGNTRVRNLKSPGWLLSILSKCFAQGEQTMVGGIEDSRRITYQICIASKRLLLVVSLGAARSTRSCQVPGSRWCRCRKQKREGHAVCAVPSETGIRIPVSA